MSELPRSSNAGAIYHSALPPVVIDRIKSRLFGLLVTALFLMVQTAWTGFLVWWLLLRHVSPWDAL
jgi:hypothetical protein